MEIAEEQIGNALGAARQPAGSTAPAPQASRPPCSPASTADPARLVLDLAGVEYVSSAGLRAILIAAKRGKGVGCALAVVRPARARSARSSRSAASATSSPCTRRVDEALRS